MSPTLALLLTVFGALLLLAVKLDDIATRIKVPGILLVLLLGLLTVNQLNGVPGQGTPLLSLSHADQLAQCALVLVLFFGGLTTNWQELRAVLRPAVRLATIGALLTALLLTAVVLALDTLPITRVAPGLPLALFIGAMVCSTDASAVLAMLRPLHGRLPKRLLDLIASESALNDPVAVVLAGLALAMAGAHGGPTPTALLPSSLVIEVLRQFLLGALLGFLGGTIAIQLLASRSQTNDPVLAVKSLALLFTLAGGTELMGGSGLLAAYLAGLVLGNTSQCDRSRLEEAHAGFTKMAELLLFLCMGLVVRPEAVVASFPYVSVLFLAMLAVRWLMVELVLLRSGFRPAEKRMVAFCGLRGAVPIAMAIQAAASSVPWGRSMPPLALGVVLLGLLVQGMALTPLARRLGLDQPA